MMNIYRLGNSRAILVKGDKDSCLDDIKKEELLKLLQKHGAILFRGYDTSLASYSDLIAKLSIKVTCDPARKASLPNTQLIQAGVDAQGFHCENATLPFWPHLQWFYCNVAPHKGSQTTLCDGFEVKNCLRVPTLKLFQSKKIQLSRNIPEHLWKKYVMVELGIPIDLVNSEHLKQISALVPGANFTLNNDGSVYLRLLTYAAHKTLFSKRIAFANSILTPSYNYEKPKITFENEKEIPADILNEITDVTNKLAVEINWEHGDMLVIDNTSVMHGRRKIDDPKREIYGAQSYIYNSPHNIAQ